MRVSPSTIAAMPAAWATGTMRSQNAWNEASSMPFAGRISDAMSPPVIAARNFGSNASVLTPEGAISTMRQRLGGKLVILLSRLRQPCRAIMVGMRHRAMAPG